MLPRLVAVASGLVFVVACSSTGPQVVRSQPPPPSPVQKSTTPQLAEQWLDEVQRRAEADDLEGARTCAEAVLALLASTHQGDPSAAADVEDVLALMDSLEDRLAAAEESGAPGEDIPLEAAREELAEEEQPAEPEAGGETAESEPVTSGIPVVMNRHVRRFLEALTTPGEFRQRIVRGFRQSTRYLEMIRTRLRAVGLPEELGWLPVIESGFSPVARSRAGASGLWQFMASTGRLYGLRVGPLIDERRDPVRSTEAAIAHLSDLYAELGDWYLALAAYNSGVGNVRRAIRRAHSTDFWKIRRYLPRETRDYVPAFLASLVISRNPDRYGIDPPQPQPWPYDEIQVPDALDLHFLAERLGVRFETLRELNPALRYALTPAGTTTTIRVPAGMGDAARSVLEATPRKAWAPRLIHTVRRGESLYVIARRYGSSVAAIRRANRLRSSLIHPGQRLVVPRGRGVRRVWSRPRARDDRGRYTVRPGDTLWDIARTFGTTVERLAAVNGIRPNGVLRPGRKLVIPGRKTKAHRTSHGGYRVRHGDTLYGIARRFGVSVHALKLANRLRSNLIRPGQRLVIPPRSSTG